MSLRERLVGLKQVEFPIPAVKERPAEIHEECPEFIPVGKGLRIKPGIGELGVDLWKVAGQNQVLTFAGDSNGKILSAQVLALGIRLVKQAGIVTLDCRRWGGFQHTDRFRQPQGPGQHRAGEFQTIPVNDQGAAGPFDRNLGAQDVGLRDLTDAKPNVRPFQFLLGELQGILGNLDLGLKPQHFVVGLGNAEQHATNGELVAFLLLPNRVLAESPRREK